MWNFERFCVFWRRGGNWGVFLVFWFIVSAIISALEHTVENVELNEEEQTRDGVRAFSGFMKMQKEEFANNSVLANQIEQMVELMDDNPDVARLFSKLDLEVALVQHKVIKTVVDIVKDEFARIESNLDGDDKGGIDLANRIIKLLSEESTVEVFQKSGENHVKKLNEEVTKRKNACSKKKAEGDSCGKDWSVSYGNALHLSSSVFTTTGFGWHSPITTGGKVITMLLIIFQIPFYLHCLATTATQINNLLDNILGLSSKHQDLEELTMETANTRQRHLVLLKGLVVLAGFLFVHMMVAAIYHFCTTGWSFTDVLYFEFVRTASVGFGDILPEDEFTLVGAIFKNLLVNIPGQVITFALFVRALPIMS